jgi:hypothetical protein
MGFATSSTSPGVAQPVFRRHRPEAVLAEDTRMTRLALALAVWMSLAGVATASLESRKQSLSRREDAWAALTVPPSAVRASQPQFQVTEQTEVLLDGKPCRYAEVPATAVIIKMEVAEDKKTVLKVHFRSRKR